MSTRSTAALTRGLMRSWWRQTLHRLRMTMTDADRLLREYIERFESGGSADPNDLLDRAQAADRTKLAPLIEGYLEHAARLQAWDPEAFDGSVADRAVAR